MLASIKAALVGLLVLVVTALPVAAQNFPFTVPHQYGETTIDVKPERVVALGLNDQDFLYALGVAPVGVKEWWGAQPYATWPWAEDERVALGAEPEVLDTVETNVEWVAAQKPDLIVAIYSDMDEDLYKLLSGIAPVVAAPAGYPVWGTPWQEQLRQIERATYGTTEKSEQIIAGIEAEFAKARAEYPALEGKTASMADYRNGQFTLWSKTHAPTRFMTSFGTVFPDELDARADDTGWIWLSPENIDLMDLDVVVWPNGKRDEIEALSVYKNSRLYKEGRSVWLGEADGDLPPALWFQTPLSLEYAISRAVPFFAAAVDGDPETSVLAE